MRYALPALALACALTGCKPQPISPADEQAIRATYVAYATSANAGSVDGLVANYASDATVQPPGAPAATGTEAIRRMYTGMLAAVRPHLTLTATKVAGQGDVAYVTGTYHLTYTMKDSTQAAPPAEDGKFVDVQWRQADKSWKIVASSWNQNSMPAAPPAAPARGRRH